MIGGAIRARVELKTGRNDWRPGGTWGSPGDGTHQGDEQVQLGDGRGQGEGEEDQTDPEDVLRLQVVVRLDPEY